METKNDLRYHKTHMKIREALQALLIQKEVNNIKNITVKEISEHANINRKTFYLHYYSLDDLFMEIIHEIAEEFLEMIRKHPSLLTSNQISDLCRAMNKLLNENYEFHMRIIASDKYQFLVEKVQELIIIEFLPEWEKLADTSSSSIKLIAFGIANGILSMYRLNYIQNMGLSLEQIAELSDKVIGIKGNECHI